MTVSTPKYYVVPESTLKNLIKEASDSAVEAAKINNHFSKVKNIVKARALTELMKQTDVITLPGKYVQNACNSFSADTKKDAYEDRKSQAKSNVKKRGSA